MTQWNGPQSTDTSLSSGEDFWTFSGGCEIMFNALASRSVAPQRTGQVLMSASVAPVTLYRASNGSLKLTDLVFVHGLMGSVQTWSQSPNARRSWRWRP